ncbi:hypothetical protein Tco_0409254 [Tanacetum coccineum]
MVAFLEKSTGSAGFHQVIDFLNRSHICYALTKKPDVYISFIKQFWRSAEATTDDNGEVQITATIDGHSMTITEASLRRHLKLDDHDGITSIPNSEIFEQLALMGYHTDSDKLTFQKGAFSPQWSDEGSLKLNELTNLVTKLSERIGVLEDDLRKINKTYSSAFTKLILRVKKLEARVKIGKARKRAKVVLSEDDKDVKDNSSKQGRKLSDAEVQEKASNETEPIIQEVTPTEVIQDQESSEKGNAEVSTAGATKGTSSEVPVQRTRKDKGKAIMTKSEPKKKSKKELEQEKLSFAEAIRLQEQMDEEQRAQITKDEERGGGYGGRGVDETKTLPSKAVILVKYLKNQGNYKISDFKGMSYNEIRPIFEKFWDFNQHIEPMEHGSEKMKSPEKIEERDVDTQKEMKEVSKESGAKRKKSLPRKSTRGTVKRQKMDEETEKEDLKRY